MNNIWICFGCIGSINIALWMLAVRLGRLKEDLETIKFLLTGGDKKSWEILKRHEALEGLAELGLLKKEKLIVGKGFKYTPSDKFKDTFGTGDSK